jgi:hypothetical protein
MRHGRVPSLSIRSVLQLSRRGRTGLRRGASDEVGLQPACPPYSSTDQQNESRKNMNLFSIIGVVVVVLVLLGYFGFR